MSVIVIFNKLAGEGGDNSFDVRNAIEPRKAIFLREDRLVDHHGLILAERVETDHGVMWLPVCAENEVKLQKQGFGGERGWLCQEVALVGVGRLNL